MLVDPISELRGVTWHVGSDSVRPTCHQTQVNAPRLNSSLPSRYSIYLPWGDGWVDLGSLIEARPGIEPMTTWSQVRCPNRYATKPPYPTLPTHKSPLSVGNRGPCLIECYLGPQVCQMESTLAGCTSVTDDIHTDRQRYGNICVAISGIAFSDGV